MQRNLDKTQWKGKLGLKTWGSPLPSNINFNFFSFLIKLILLFILVISFIRGFLFVDKVLTIKELQLSVEKKVITKYIKDLNIPLEANVEIIKNKIEELEGRSIIKYIHLKNREATIMRGKNKGKKIKIKR